MINLARCAENPIVRPGEYPWRKIAAFNPAASLEGGKFRLYERTAGSLRPFQCHIGLLESEDGIHFEHVSESPVLSPEMLGLPYGSVQDPRIVKIEGSYLMSYAVRACAYNYYPTGLGVPDSDRPAYPDGWGKPEHWITRSGIAESADGLHFRHRCYTTPADVDDRDNVLFPERIGGRYALLRRPLSYIGSGYGTDAPSIWISYSENLSEWSYPVLLAKPEFGWEGGKIGAASPPLRTEEGWLTLYHGVDERSVYRVGAMLLDLENPELVLARCPDFVMEPEEYYEKVGLFIPNVVFPTGNVIKDDILHVYYGCADTAIGLATIPVNELLDHVMTTGKRRPRG